MKKHLILLICLLLNCTITTFAQTTYVILRQYSATKETKYIQNMMLKSFPLKDNSQIKGMPSICEKQTIHTFFINYDQAMYDRFRSNEIPSINYERYTNAYKVDTTTLSSDINNPQNSILVYVGLSMVKNQKYVIIDSNNDKDFSNDSIYTFSLNEYQNTSPFRYQDSICPIIHIKTNYFDGNKSIPVVASVVLNPFSAFEDDIKNYPSKEDFYLQVLLLSNDYFSGVIRISPDIDLTINSSHGTMSVYKPTLSSQSGFMIFDNDYKGYPIMHKIGDTVIVAKRKLHLAGREENKLFITDLGAAQDSSMVGDYVPQLAGKSISDDNQIILNPLFKDKYVFIDFWGSWCAPCIESLPKLRELYEQVKNRPDVTICGIALEQPKDLQRLNNIIADRKIEWLNIWSDSKSLKNLDSPHGKLKINSFPSYVIVDKSGKILFTTTDKKCSRDSAIYFFKALISKE